MAVNVATTLRKAVTQLKKERGRIDQQIAALEGVLAGPGRPAQAKKSRPGKRRTMTAAQKKAVSARMKKYWAARRSTPKK